MVLRMGTREWAYNSFIFSRFQLSFRTALHRFFLKTIENPAPKASRNFFGWYSGFTFFCGSDVFFLFPRFFLFSRFLCFLLLFSLFMPSHQHLKIIATNFNKPAQPIQIICRSLRKFTVQSVNT